MLSFAFQFQYIYFWQKINESVYGVYRLHLGNMHDLLKVHRLEVFFSLFLSIRLIYLLSSN